MSSNLYPPSPSNIPVGFTNPGKKYTWQVLIAAFTVLAFVLFYFGFSSWLIYKSVKLFYAGFAGSNGQFKSLISTVVLGFLGVFMLKGLFFIIRREQDNNFEILPEDEPELFRFIYQVADEAKAPRPYKVFLSSVVNASVFYNISIVNLIFPGKKNLEIGLGLVNSINIAEFKAILAHEFGHFGQKSMIIGRWVYIAHQVAYQIVAKRDGFDSFLSAISRIDIRVAWIGWLLSIIVWSLRSIAETFFKLVVLAQRALSREMEFHADKVAVSLAGSDSIVEGLYKLNTADEAYEASILFVNRQLKQQKIVPDIFSIQTAYINNMKVVMDDEKFETPVSKEITDRSNIFIFKQEVAQSPKMWSTHPSNTDREKNAKKIYIASVRDDRSAWLLFKDPVSTRFKLTQRAYTKLPDNYEHLSDENAVKIFDNQFKKSFFDRKFKGVYVNRAILLSHKVLNDSYTLLQPEVLKNGFNEMYPDSVINDLSQYKELQEEVKHLEAIESKHMDAPDGKVVYRGEEIKPRQLEDVILRSKLELKEVEKKLFAHDKLCRSFHYTIAANLGKDYSAYWLSVLQLIHFTEHVQKLIENRTRFFYDSLSHALRLKTFTNDKVYPVIGAGNKLYDVLNIFFINSSNILFNEDLKNKLNGKQYGEMLEEFKLGYMSIDNINNWIEVLPSWLEHVNDTLEQVRDAALDELISFEVSLDTYYLNATKPPLPDQIIVPTDYAVYDEAKAEVHTERPDVLSTFYHGDGIFPTTGRITIAASIIFFAFFFSAGLGNSTIYLYNGLYRDVIVHIGSKEVRLGENESKSVSLSPQTNVKIETTTGDGLVIESFNAPMGSTPGNYVYNIANAAVLYEWEAVYGSSIFAKNQNEQFELIGTERWFKKNAEHYFEDPPQSVSVRAGSSKTLTVISAVVSVPAMDVISYISDTFQVNTFVRSHAMWDEDNSPYILSWMSYAAQQGYLPAIINHRLSIDSNEVISLRAKQDYLGDQVKNSTCETLSEYYLSDPQNSDYYYLKTRCEKESKLKDDHFIEGYLKWKDNTWLAMASGYVYAMREEWEPALECFKSAYSKELVLKDFLYSEIARICHLLYKESDIPSIEGFSSGFANYSDIVQNAKEGDALFAFHYLSQGKITEAISASMVDSSIYPVILRLAAVSDGASQQVINSAKDLPFSQGLGSNTLIPAMALDIKQNKSIEGYKDIIGNYLQVEPDTFMLFAQYIQKGKVNLADQLMPLFTPETKGKACLLGILVLGNNTPEKWNLYASRLLFSFEKPYRKSDLDVINNDSF